MPNFPPSHVVANFPVTILHPITSNPMHQLQPGHTSCTNPAKKHQWARDSNRVKSALAMTRFSHILLSYMWCFHRIECSLFRSASCCILYSVPFFFFFLPMTRDSIVVQNIVENSFWYGVQKGEMGSKSVITIIFQPHSLLSIKWRLIFPLYSIPAKQAKPQKARRWVSPSRCLHLVIWMFLAFVNLQSSVNLRSLH